MNHANAVSMIYLLFILLLLTIFSTIRLHDLAHLSIAFYTTSTLLLACSALPDLFRTDWIILLTQITFRQLHVSLRVRGARVIQLTLYPNK